jgi:hypothetical protein
MSSENSNKTVILANTISQKDNLQTQVDGLTKSLDTLTNPLAISYKKGDIDIFYFNAAWFAIGGIFFVVLFVFFTSKRTAGVREKGRTAASSRLHRKEVEIPDVYDIREERPSVEKEMLKVIVPKEKTKRDEISKDVDNIINNKRIDNILNRKV